MNAKSDEENVAARLRYIEIKRRGVEKYPRSIGPEAAPWWQLCDALFRLVYWGQYPSLFSRDERASVTEAVYETFRERAIPPCLTT